MQGRIQKGWKKARFYLSGLNPDSPRQFSLWPRSTFSDFTHRIWVYLAGFRQTNLKDIGTKLIEAQTLRKTLITFFALFGILYVLDKADPFGVSRAAQSHSESLFQKITSSFYPSGAQERAAAKTECNTRPFR